MLHENFSIRKLDALHQKNKFTCGVAILDDYIQKVAKQDNKRHVAMIYILSDDEENKIAGYYSLSSTSMELLKLPESVKKNLPPYLSLPATLLGRLAIDLQYQHKKLGKFLLLDALKRAFEVSQHVASFAVIVEAINESAANFYLKFGFIFLEKNKYYFPMKSIKELYF